MTKPKLNLCPFCSVPVVKLKVGCWYRAKKPRKIWFFGEPGPAYNDRHIIYLGPFTVQYDGPTVKLGQHYPAVAREKFIAWAGKEITADDALCPWLQEGRKP